MENQWQKDILLKCYPKDILRMMNENYRNKKRNHLIENGFTFERFILTAYKLGFTDSNSYQIRRIDTKKPYSETNMRLKPTDGMQKKLKSLSTIIRKNDLRKVKIKINEEKPFRKFA